MPQHIVIIGAVALGPKAACRFKRLSPDSKVTMIDAGKSISYGGCGIPYFVSGDVSAPEELQTTSFHMIRNQEFFRTTKGVEALTRTRALAIDRKNKTVRVRNEENGQERDISYDKLVLAMGSTPRRPPFEGTDLDGVFTVASLDEAVDIREKVTKGEVEKAVVIGAGFIGLEMAEALADMWGIETSVVEIADQILPGLVSKNLAPMAVKQMQDNGVSFYFSEKVVRIEGEGKVERVVTDKRTLEADMVIMAAGVRPNSDLAKAAGLDVSEHGGVIVDERLQTSDPNIFAGGDLIQVKNRVMGKPGYLPMGSMANRQGRVIGDNLAGGTSRFGGVVGSFCVKLFELAAAGAGLSIEAAKRAGYDAINVHMSQLDRAHFYPNKGLMYLDLVVEKKTARVLGIQGVSNMGDALIGRINVVASMLKDRPTVRELSNVEMAYSPPFAAAMDIINSLGNVADNILAGRNRGVGLDEFQAMWAERENGKRVFLDCRSIGDAEKFLEKYPSSYWMSIPQEDLAERMDEVPRDKEVVLICNTGARSYEAQVMLDNIGVTNTKNLQGGMASAKMWGIDI